MTYLEGLIGWINSRRESMRGESGQSIDITIIIILAVLLLIFLFARGVVVTQ